MADNQCYEPLIAINNHYSNHHSHHTILQCSRGKSEQKNLFVAKESHEKCLGQASFNGLVEGKHLQEPSIFPWFIWDFPVIFPLNQSIESWAKQLHGTETMGVFPCVFHGETELDGTRYLDFMGSKLMCWRLDEANVTTQGNCHQNCQCCYTVYTVRGPCIFVCICSCLSLSLVNIQVLTMVQLHNTCAYNLLGLQGLEPFDNSRSDEKYRSHVRAGTIAVCKQMWNFTW